MLKKLSILLPRRQSKNEPACNEVSDSGPEEKVCYLICKVRIYMTVTITYHIDEMCSCAFLKVNILPEIEVLPIAI